MKLEQIIRKKRILERAVQERNDEEAKKMLHDLIKDYNDNLDISDVAYIDYGYYRFHNNEVYKTVKELAEFRTLLGLNGQEINLIKTDNENWDIMVNGLIINLVPNFEEETLVKIDNDDEIRMILDRFYNLKQQYCGHLEFINNGYYFIENQSIKSGDYNNSDFRIVTCGICQKVMLLPKTEKCDWNSRVNNNVITVVKMKKKSKTL